MIASSTYFHAVFEVSTTFESQESADGQNQLRFDFTGQHAEAHSLKASFHPIGAVKIAGMSAETPFLRGAPFFALSGQHIATVRLDGLEKPPGEPGTVQFIDGSLLVSYDEDAS